VALKYAADNCGKGRFLEDSITRRCMGESSPFFREDLCPDTAAAIEEPPAAAG
jgi:hypothetical protein